MLLELKTNLSRAAAAFSRSLFVASSGLDDDQLLLFSVAVELRGGAVDAVTTLGTPAVVLGIGTVLPILAKG